MQINPTLFVGGMPKGSYYLSVEKMDWNVSVVK